MELQSSTGDPLTPFVGLFGRRPVWQLDALHQPLRAQERRSAHGHRRVFLSDLFVAQLLALCHPTVRCLRNPTVRRLRTLDALSCTAAARTVLQVARLPRSPVSDAHALVDPTRLEPLRIAIATGCRPSMVALAIMQFVAAGLTDLKPMLPTLERFEAERERARLRREKRRAALRVPQ